LLFPRVFESRPANGTMHIAGTWRQVASANLKTDADGDVTMPENIFQDAICKLWEGNKFRNSICDAEKRVRVRKQATLPHNKK